MILRLNLTANVYSVTLPEVTLYLSYKSISSLSRRLGVADNQSINNNILVLEYHI